MQLVAIQCPLFVSRKPSLPGLVVLVLWIVSGLRVIVPYMPQPVPTEIQTLLGDRNFGQSRRLTGVSPLHHRRV